MEYTKQEIINQLHECIDDISLFYKQDFINYRGKTADTNELYTEIISEWLIDNICLLEQIPIITRSASYAVEGHDGVPKHLDSNREEELIAMEMFRQETLPFVGKLLDYQTPLKNTRKDKAGKIDLIAYDGEILRILELKEPESKETMLRCVLEGYTYLKTVNHKKLLADFGLPPNTVVEATPFVFYRGYQWVEMQQNRVWLKRLMGALKIKPFYIKKENELYVVVED